MLIQDFLIPSLKKGGNDVFLKDAGGRIFTYEEFYQEVLKIAAGLVERGLERHDRVVISCSNNTYCFLTIWSVVMAGGIAIPISTRVGPQKLSYILKDSSPKFVMMEQGAGLNTQSHRETLGEFTVFYIVSDKREPLKEISDDEILPRTESKRHLPRIIDVDPALVIYTSGSTGTPKGILLSHANVTAAAQSISQYLDLTHEDKILDFLPPFFDYGLYQVLLASVVGASVFLLEGSQFIDEIVRTILREQSTILPIVPSFASRFLSRPETRESDFDSVRVVTSTGAPLSSKFITELAATFKRAKIFSMYGLTECKRVSYLPPELCLNFPKSVGIAMPNVDIDIVDDEGQPVGVNIPGQLIVRGSNVAQGYWNDKELSSRVFRPGQFGERVLWTGDYFYRDNNGLLYFVGRKDDLVKVGEIRISLKEVEDILMGLPDVLEVAVVAKPDINYNASLTAFIVKKTNSPITETQVTRHCRSSLEHDILVPVVKFVESLPKTDTGKVNKAKLANE